MIVASRLAVLARDQTVVTPLLRPVPSLKRAGTSPSLPSVASLSALLARDSPAARDLSDLLQF